MPEQLIFSTTSNNSTSSPFIRGFPSKIQGQIWAEQDFILYGCTFLENFLETSIQKENINWQFKEGQKVLKNQVIASIQGELNQLLRLEQKPLSLLKYLSGLATWTQKVSKRIKTEQPNDKNCQLLFSPEYPISLNTIEKDVITTYGGSIDNSSEKRITLRESNFSSFSEFCLFARKVRNENQQAIIHIEVTNSGSVSLATDLKIRRVIFKDMDLPEVKKSILSLSAFIETGIFWDGSLEQLPSLLETGVDFITISNFSQQFFLAKCKLVLNTSDKLSL